MAKIMRSIVIAFHWNIPFMGQNLPIFEYFKEKPFVKPSLGSFIFVVIIISYLFIHDILFIEILRTQAIIVVGRAFRIFPFLAY